MLEISSATAVIILLLVVATVGVAYVGHKARRIHLKLFESDAVAEARVDKLFAQVEALMALTRELGLPAGLQSTRGWAGSPDFLLHVFRSAIHIKPVRVVECSSGVSTVVLARAMQLNGRGHVWSLEHEEAFAQKTRAELQRHGLQDFATVLHAPLRAQSVGGQDWKWYDASVLPTGSIDMLVIDGPPMTTQPLARYPAVPVLAGQLADGATVMLDDAARPDEREIVRRWLAEHGMSVADTLYAEKGIANLQRRVR